MLPVFDTYLFFNAMYISAYYCAYAYLRTAYLRGYFLRFWKILQVVRRFLKCCCISRWFHLLRVCRSLGPGRPRKKQVIPFRNYRFRTLRYTTSRLYSTVRVYHTDNITVDRGGSTKPE